jgi:hypothetical protein
LNINWRVGGTEKERDIVRRERGPATHGCSATKANNHQKLTYQERSWFEQWTMARTGVTGVFELIMRDY